MSEGAVVDAVHADNVRIGVQRGEDGGGSAVPAGKRAGDADAARRRGAERADKGAFDEVVVTERGAFVVLYAQSKNERILVGFKGWGLI